MPPARGLDGMGARSRSLLVLFGVTLVLLFVDLGHTPFFEPDEGRYAEIPREMLATGDFITPRLNGVLYFEKPPLHYWSVAASFKLFGLSESAARLPGRLASAGMALLTFFFARRRYGERVALLAGLIVSSSALVFFLSHITIIDPSLSFALSAAAFSFIAYEEAERSGDARRARRALYGLHVSCAAAVMLKGLIGIVLPGGAILLFTLLAGRTRLLPRLFSPGPLLVFLVLAVPWHVEVARRNPDFANFYFIHEHFDRFAKADHRRPGPWYYFLGVLLVGFLPWTGFLGRLMETFPSRLQAFRERSAESFLWVFTLVVFLFFSASRSKLIPYIEPVWPAVSLLLAIGIERAQKRGARFVAERVVTGALYGALLVAAIGWGYGGGYLARFGAPRVALLAAFGLTLGFLNVSPRLSFSRRSDRSGRQDFVPRVAAPWLVFYAGLLFILPGAARWVTPWPLVEAVLRELRPGDLLLQRGHYVQVVPFYTRRKTPIAALGWYELDFGRTRDGSQGLFPTEEEFAILWNGPRRVLVVTHRDHVRDFGNPALGFLGAPLVLGRQSEGKHYLLANR